MSSSPTSTTSLRVGEEEGNNKQESSYSSPSFAPFGDRLQGLGRINFSTAFLPPYLSICVSGMLLGVAVGVSSLLILLHNVGFINSAAGAGMSTYVLMSFVMFHFCEFACAVLYRPHDCSPDSFLFFHSYAFLIAQGSVWVEIIVRYNFFAGEAQWQGCGFRIVLGVLLCILTYGVRVKGMVDCGSNFAFQIETERRHSHVLVKTGVYKYCRHPSYFGSFWFFLATQFLAGNWFNFILFFFVLRFFFRERILKQEEPLLESEEFFGEEYKAYKSVSYVGIPILNEYPFFC